MAVGNKRTIQNLIKKRNRAYDSLAFYERYPDIFAKQERGRNEHRLKEAEIKIKNRLLPLELKAKPVAEVNRWKIEKELRAARVAQRKTREDLEKFFRMQVEKGNEATAAAEKEAALKKLDGELEALRAKLEAQYPVDAEGQPSPEDVAAYEAADKTEYEKLDALRAELEEKSAARIAKVRAKAAEKDRKYRAVFDACNAKLDRFAKISEEEFGADTILSIRNLKMYFSGVKAVDDISFDIKKGEIFGLIGPNGAGKTTIFNCVTQFYKPTAGNVFYRDRFGKIVDLTDYRTHDVIKSGIARTFQNLEMVLGLSILDNMKVGAHSLYRANLFGEFLHTKQLKEEEEVTGELAESILQRLGLSGVKNALPQGQPYGVLKKIELGRTLMTHPQLIILDEPAAGLNDAETAELAETIRKIRDEFNCTIFLVEHDMNLVMNICDTICVCSFGKRLAIGKPEEVRANRDVQEAYLGVEEEE